MFGENAPGNRGLNHSNTIELYHQPQTTEANERQKEIFAEYKLIHQTYANLAAQDVEALKRGLFLQWYALAEPNYLTGLLSLDKEAGNRIIEALNKQINTGQTDSELVWMLNYYSHSDWIFEEFESFKGFDAKIVNEQNDNLPKDIDRDKMRERGQMGRY